MIDKDESVLGQIEVRMSLIYIKMFSRGSDVPAGSSSVGLSHNSSGFLSFIFTLDCIFSLSIN